MTFKEKLVILRKGKSLTQDEFASAVGVSRQAVYKWESGQSYPEVAKLLEIKYLFDISIDDLLDENYEVILPEKKKRRRLSKEAKAQIEAQVAAILNQWFGSEQPQIDTTSERPRILNGNNDFGGNYWDSQPVTIPVVPESAISPNRSNTSLGGFKDDEDVVID